MYLKKAEEGLWKSEEKLIKKYFIKKNSKVLDIGCGTGRTTIVLHKMNYKIIGIDITPKMIENAKKIAKNKKLKIDYRIGDATKLKFRSETFDYALFSNQGWAQIPGSEERLKALKEVYRILKKEGIFIFTVHSRLFFSKRFFFWALMWFKFYVLRPLGFYIEGIEFGDKLFIRESEVTNIKTKQYIHVPNVNYVTKQIKNVGFRILYTGYGLTEQPKPNTEPTFFVCKK